MPKITFNTSSREEVIHASAIIASQMHLPKNKSTTNCILLNGDFAVGKSLIADAIVHEIFDSLSINQLLTDGEQDKMCFESRPAEVRNKPLLDDGSHHNNPIRIIFTEFDSSLLTFEGYDPIGMIKKECDGQRKQQNLVDRPTIIILKSNTYGSLTDAHKDTQHYKSFSTAITIELPTQQSSREDWQRTIQVDCINPDFLNVDNIMRCNTDRYQLDCSIS